MKWHITASFPGPRDLINNYICAERTGENGNATVGFTLKARH